MGPISVRRNLFHHNLSRRPVSTAPPPNPLAHDGSGVSTLQTRMKSSSAESAASTLRSRPVDNGDIVVKDKNGGYELDIPILPPTLESDGDEISGGDEARASAGAGAAGTDSTGDTEISGREKEKIEASLVEMMCRNRNRQLSSEPAVEGVVGQESKIVQLLTDLEILNLIHQSLRNKVAALEEDNWMYDAETEPRP